MDAAWIGVIGVAVGVLAGYPVQALLAKRAESAARSQALRADRLSAYSSFAERVMDWRRSQIRRAMLTIAPPGEDKDNAAIRDENQRLRAAAWTAYYHVRLLCDDPEIETSARKVVEATRAMKKAIDRQHLNAAGDLVREELNRFLDEASRQTVSEGLAKSVR